MKGWVMILYLFLTINTNPIKKNKGSNFIHIAKNNYSATRGCIAIKERHLSQINRKTLVKII